MDNMKRDLPVAVFDSGLGGISVLRELRALMPEENYLYFGDSANAPYGVRSLDEVRALTVDAISGLYQRGIKAAVIACNTATSAAITTLRERFADIPVIGMEPALKPAVLEHPHECVLVLATALTLREEKFSHLMERYDQRAEVISLPCPELVEFVERGELDSPALDAYLQQRLGPWRERADAAVLGCTHFPFLKNAIRKALNENAVLYDGGAGTARQTRRQLELRDLRREGDDLGSVVIENSLDTPEILGRSCFLLEL